jgi:hypothetical protein
MSRMTPRQIDALRMATAAAEAWNLRHEPGQLVEFQSHPEAKTKTTKTRSPAFLVDNATPCVMLEGVQGAAALRCCQAIEASAAAELAAATGQPNKHHQRRERLRAKLGAMINELDVQRTLMARAKEAVVDDSLLEFSLDVKGIAKSLEAIAQQLFSLHLTEERSDA